ncbi:MAG: hypothetical protein M1419_00510 [Bacteroidetes bacterium]|nr:hypothetical protein [Bacteroidota bacterium]
MATTSIQGIIEEAELLSFEDQRIFIDLFQKRFIESRRNEIDNNGKRTIKAIKEKKAKIGSLDDFINDVD